MPDVPRRRRRNKRRTLEAVTIADVPHASVPLPESPSEEATISSQINGGRGTTTGSIALWCVVQTRRWLGHKFPFR